MTLTHNLMFAMHAVDVRVTKSFEVPASLLCPEPCCILLSHVAPVSARSLDQKEGEVLEARRHRCKCGSDQHLCSI